MLKITLCWHTVDTPEGVLVADHGMPGERHRLRRRSCLGVGTDLSPLLLAGLHAQVGALAICSHRGRLALLGFGHCEIHHTYTDTLSSRILPQGHKKARPSVDERAVMEH